jgi:hypothetical protein
MLRALLTLSVLLAASSWSQNPPPGRGTANPKRADSPQSAGQLGTDARPLVIKQLPTTNTDEESAQVANDRAGKIANDKKLVQFTGYLVVATWTLGAIGLFQLIVFGMQARRLRQTVDAAADQSKAMERSISEANRLASAMERVSKDIAISASAATESVAALRERTAQQMRAYLSVVVGTGIYQDKAKNLKFQAQPLVVNAGHTPAHKVSFKAKTEVLPVPLPDAFTFPLPVSVTGGAVVGPQQSFTLSPMVDDFSDEAEVEKIKRAEGKALFAWGIITYEDVFGQSHQTRFCQIVTWLPDGKTWGYYTDRHNDAT